MKMTQFLSILASAAMLTLPAAADSVNRVAVGDQISVPANGHFETVTVSRIIGERHTTDGMIQELDVVSTTGDHQAFSWNATAADG